MSRNWMLVPLLVSTVMVFAEEPETERTAMATEPQAQAEKGSADEPEKTEAAAQDATETENKGPKVISGMSVLGNQEAPKSLVIVPWKSSQIGDSLGISSMLDDSKQPIDRDVFMRELSYYEIRSEGTP